ncbi:hypothetical protein NDU88_000899 [Pleurodeles waltl]|uniref:Uncharacterized protein n=1 Tax=Pleurodeles waltl TaxID=8319 RepID=A0AAV7V879_PLEWA|nr:hypothetical protein NDU88_000899 [Pleurodeles waltl]
MSGNPKVAVKISHDSIDGDGLLALAASNGRTWEVFRAGDNELIGMQREEERKGATHEPGGMKALKSVKNSHWEKRGPKKMGNKGHNDGTQEGPAQLRLGDQALPRTAISLNSEGDSIHHLVEDESYAGGSGGVPGKVNKPLRIWQAGKEERHCGPQRHNPGRELWQKANSKFPIFTLVGVMASGG